MAEAFVGAGVAKAGATTVKAAKTAIKVEKAAETAAKVETVSPNVQKVLKTLGEIKKEGGTVTPNNLKANQELNLTIKKGSEKLDVRIETHDVPKKYGGEGKGKPVRHMNVDPSPGKNKLPNKGHKILKNGG